MKKMLILSAVWTLVCVPSVCAEDAAASGPTGRFQLVQGRYSHWDGDKDVMTEKNDLFMIDTISGETWYYASASKGKKESRYWLVANFDGMTPGSAPAKPPAASGDKAGGEWQKV